MSRPRLPRLGALGVILGLALLAWIAGACKTGPDAAEWVAEASGAHQRADEALARGEPEGARAILVALLDQPAPDELADADRRAVLQDVYHRLAEIDLVLSNPRQALAWAERGLELGQEDDLFTANLLVSRGRAHEALGRDEAAASDYYDALRINERLLRQHLGTQEGGEPR